MCGNGITGVESSDGKACCPSECGSCATGCDRRRLSGDSSDSNSSGTACGTRKRRRRLTYGHDDSSDSSDGYEDYCDCNTRRALRSGSSSDSGDSECECECETEPEPEVECCADTIVGNGQMCDDVGSAPCVIGESTPEPTPEPTPE
ncbi:unnamed protein product, partial [Ectocarpus fasciculatus]